MSRLLQYSAIVKAKVKNVIDEDKSELYLLCRQYSDNKEVVIENEGLEIILDKSVFKDLIFLNDCEILSFEHLCNVYSLEELKEACKKYDLTDIEECMKGNNLNCRGLIINEYLEPLGWEEELEDNNDENNIKQEKINKALIEYREGKISFNDYIKVCEDNWQDKEEKEIEYIKSVSRKIRSKYKAKGEIIKRLSEEELYEKIGGYLKSFLEENDIETDIVDFQIIGSRNKGVAKEDSDLDVLVEYNNDSISEDSLYNSLNDERNGLNINGIQVDFNPITPSKSGTIDEWLKRNYNYDKYKENMKEYAKYIIDCLKENFKNEISYVYRITFLTDIKSNRYTVSLAIDIDNNGNKDQINFISADKFYKMNSNEQVKYIGNFYNASIIGKRKEDFDYDEAKKDFLKICDFNFTKDKEEEEL